MNNKLNANINRIYTLFRDVPTSLQHLKTKFSDYIKDNVSRLLKESHLDPIDWSQKLIDIYNENVILVKLAFDDSNDFNEINKSAIRDTLQQEFIPCDCLSIYLDSKLKENMDIDTFNDIINQSLNIFQLIPNKDYFKNAYEKTVIRRILDGKIMSEENENYVLSKLKEIMYPQYTENLEKLFSDYKTGLDEKSQIIDKMHSNHFNNKIPFQVTILPLAQGVWPLENYDKCNLPPEFKQCITALNTLYSSIQQRKVLKWIISEVLITIFLGKCCIKN